MYGNNKFNNWIAQLFFSDLNLAVKIERMLSMHTFDDTTRASLIKIAEQHRVLEAEFAHIVGQILGW